MQRRGMSMLSASVRGLTRTVYLKLARDSEPSGALVAGGCGRGNVPQILQIWREKVPRERVWNLQPLCQVPGASCYASCFAAFVHSATEQGSK